MMTCGCARINGVWCPCRSHSPVSAEQQVLWLEAELKVKDLQKDALEAEVAKWRAELNGSEKAHANTLLQIEELQKKLDRRDHDLYLYWKEGFEKQGFMLHAGLTPEQNAAEWKECANRLYHELETAVRCFLGAWEHDPYSSEVAKLAKGIDAVLDKTEKRKEEA